MKSFEEIYEINSSSLVYGGDALARLPDGGAVFIPFALPGERLKIKVTGRKGRTARGEILEVLKASEDRIAPRCQHYRVCGGCHYQHMTYEAQIKAKTSILAEQFRRIAGVNSPNLQTIAPNPQPWFYRNTVQFHIDSNGKLGFQCSASNKVIAIAECYLPESPLNEFWKNLDFEPISELERVVLRHGVGEDIMLVIESGDPQPPVFEVNLPLSAVFLGPDGDFLLAGDDHLIMEVKHKPFHVLAGSFFQVNTYMAGLMVDLIQSNLDLNHRKTLLDVYSGVGLFSSFFAPLVGRCAAVELSPYAAHDYVINLDEYDNVELYEGAAEDILPQFNIKPDIAIVDPPRSGLEISALNAIISLFPQTLVYVSCDPATLARDAKRLLAAGYILEKVIPLDMFPQTYHIESVSFFRCRSN